MSDKQEDILMFQKLQGGEATIGEPQNYDALERDFREVCTHKRQE